MGGDHDVGDKFASGCYDGNSTSTVEAVKAVTEECRKGVTSPWTQEDEGGDEVGDVVIGFDLAGPLSVNWTMVGKGGHTYGIRAPDEASYMPKTMKAKKMAESLQVLIFGSFHLSFFRTTWPVPEKTLLGLGGVERSCKGMGWSWSSFNSSFDEGRVAVACSGLLGCISVLMAVVVVVVVDAMANPIARQSRQ